MDDLITRLESASEGSRELSDEVLAAVGWKKNVQGVRWGRDADGLSVHHSHLPSPTESVDAALSLMPDFKGHSGWRVSNWHEGKAGGGAWIDWSNDPVMSFSEHHVDAHAATPELALCIAALRARGAL